MGLMDRIMPKTPTAPTKAPCPCCKRFSAMGTAYSKNNAGTLYRCERCRHTWSVQSHQAAPEPPDRVVFSEPELPRQPGDPKCFSDCPNCWRQHVGTGTEEPSNSTTRVYLRCRKCREKWSMNPEDRATFHTPAEVRAFLGTRT